MNFIKYWRKRGGMTQEELAHRAGVHANSIIRWEKGHRAPGYADIIKLCKAFGITETDLMSGPQRTELTVNFYWEVDDMNAMTMKANEFSWGHRNDGMLLIAGALPWEMDVDDILARIKMELVAAKEGKKARDAVLKKEMRKEAANDGPGSDHGEGENASEGSR